MEIDPSGTDYTYAISLLKMPETAQQANTYGLDLDGDPRDRPDNALGQILSTLGMQGNLSLQDTVDGQIASGDIVILASMKATSLSTATKVGMWLYMGDKDNITPTPCTDPENPTVETCGKHLDGSGMFAVATDSPTDAKVYGQVIGGKFDGWSGAAPVQLELSLVEGATLKVNLIGTKIVANQVSEDAMTDGIIGGAITKKELDTSVMPSMVDILNSTITEYCTLTPVNCEDPESPNCKPCGCEDNSNGRVILDLFDEFPLAGEEGTAVAGKKGDCAVSLEELQQNSLIKSLLAPDVDLLNCPNADSDPADCTYEPRVDGVKDSLSLGLGFNAIKADFTVTGQ
jgi:hypothetical protein